MSTLPLFEKEPLALETSAPSEPSLPATPATPKKPKTHTKRFLADRDERRKQERALTPIVWFSCGAKGRRAALLFLKDHPHAELIYIDPGWEHEDNVRFLKDAERVLGKSIKVLRDPIYKTPADVFRKRRYLKQPMGAPCTEVLKKGVRQAYETALEVQVFGFHQGEQHRADRLLAANAEQAHLFCFPLLAAGWTKKDCLAHIESLGLELPAMYRLGFKNANCVGCVKGGKGYWKKIRRLFPARFEEMAALEDEIGYTLFDQPLRDLPWDAIKEEGGLVGECGVLCSLPLFPPAPLSP